jgi:23S rRNA pseudouridine2457 synthase
MPLILFNKPYQVLCQFTDHDQKTRPTLAHYIDTPNVYPAGRLDADSEGLMLLTDDGRLQQRISNPSSQKQKNYLVQVDGIPDQRSLARLRAPIDLGDFVTLPCQAVSVEAPDWLWQRDPPIRQRQEHPTAWLSVTITEGKNRQIRRMTAAVGLPTLRLIRIAIGRFSLATHPLQPGESMSVDPADF